MSPHSQNRYNPLRVDTQNIKNRVLKCESLIINYSIGSDIHVYTDVMPIMEFTLLGLSFEVHLCITLKQRKIANPSIFPNYFFSLIAACTVDRAH